MSTTDNSSDNNSNNSNIVSIPEKFSIVKCRVCASKVVRANVITKVRVAKTSLPASTHDGLFREAENESDFWLVDDMFKFENIGFLKTVANAKFMTCADCEKEVLGVHVTDEEPKRYLIRCDRLTYCE